MFQREQNVLLGPRLLVLPRNLSEKVLPNMLQLAEIDDFRLLHNFQRQWDIEVQLSRIYFRYPYAAEGPRSNRRLQIEIGELILPGTDQGF